MYCPDCGSTELISKGIRRLSKGVTKRDYLCKACGRRTVNPLTEDEMEPIKENVKLAKKSQKFQDLNRIERKSFRQYARLENAVMEYSKEIKDLLDTYDLSNTVKIHKCKGSKATAIVHITDTHLNELVDCKDNVYDFDVASKRLQKFAHKVKLYLAPYKVTNVLVAFTGDLLNSDRRLDELVSKATNRSKATFYAVDLFKSFILDLNQNFNISVACVSGNESRVNQEMGFTEAMVTDNYDFTIFNILKYLFKNSKGIDFIVGDYTEQVINVGGKEILLTHGYSIKHDAERDLGKIRAKFAQRGIMLDYIIFGHIHSASISDTYARGSSLVGNNSYADMALNVAGKASQNLIVITDEGDIDGIKIELQNTDNYEGYAGLDFTDCYNAKSFKKAKKVKAIKGIII